MQKITPFLWFDTQAEEAVNYYVSIFRKSKISSVSRYDEAGAAASGRPKGSVMTVAFELEGQAFVALQCGWLKDRYGLSWQIVPRVLGELLSGPDAGKAGRVMKAMLTMKKIDLAALLRAAPDRARYDSTVFGRA